MGIGRGQIGLHEKLFRGILTHGMSHADGWKRKPIKHIYLSIDYHNV